MNKTRKSKISFKYLGDSEKILDVVYGRLFTIADNNIKKKNSK